MSSLTFERDAQARDLNRHMNIIAMHARENALADGMSRDGSDALRAIAAGIKEIASQAGTICHADCGDELSALADNLSDICAHIVRDHLTPEYTAACRADERSAAMREDMA